MSPRFGRRERAASRTDTGPTRAERRRGAGGAGRSGAAPSRRWPALVLIAALVVGGVVLGSDDVAVEDPPPADPSTLLPIAVPDDALGSVWFCAGQSAGDDTPADGTLVISNPSDEAAAGRIELVSAEGEEAADEVAVEPWTTTRVRVADLLAGEWVAARVETTSGTVVVEHEVVGEAGRDVAPCQTRAADRLYLPSGATTRDAQLTLLVFNPYSDAATVDLSFVTDDGVRRPRALQGLPVPAGAVVPVDVSGVVTVRPLVATILTARRGRVVVDRVQTFDGRGAATTEEEAAEEPYQREGLTVTPAVPRTATDWVFPAGLRAPGIHEQITVFNPGEELAEVDVTLDLADPQRNGTLDPFALEVPGGEARVLDVDEAEGVPEGVTHSVTVTSTNQVPVVAERALAVTEDASYRAQLTSTGAPVVSEGWVFAAGWRGPDEEAQRIALANPGDEDVTVELVAYGDGERSAPLGDEPITLAPGEHVELDVGQLGGLEEGQTSIEVTASAPIVAERRLISRSPSDDPDADDAEPGVGGSTALGVPVGPGTAALGE